MSSTIKPSLSKDQLSLKRIHSNQKSLKHINIIQKKNSHTKNKNIKRSLQKIKINKPIHQNDTSIQKDIKLNINNKKQQIQQSSNKLQQTKLTSWIQNRIQQLQQNDYGYSNIFQVKMFKLEQNSNNKLVKRNKLTQKEQFQKLLQKYQITKHSHNKSTSRNKTKSKRKLNENLCILRNQDRSVNKIIKQKNVIKHKKCASKISLIKFTNKQQSRKGHHIRSKSNFIQPNFEQKQKIPNEINRYEQLADYFHDLSINQVQSRIIFCDDKNEQSTLNLNETLEKTTKQQKSIKLNSILYQLNSQNDKKKQKNKSNRKSLLKRLKSKKSLINLDKKGQNDTNSKLHTNRSPINKKK